MGKRYNNAGRELVVDRVIELKRRGASSSLSFLQSTISSQQILKDLDALKDALSGITSDGTISANEKPGLKREWASLQNSYVTIAEQFTSNPDLEDNAAFIALRQQYVTLSELMDKILADMTTDYTGEEVKQLSDMFVNLYQQLTVCQSVLNGINDFQRNYTINITGSREIADGSQLAAGIYRGGTEQMNPEFIDGTNYTWRRLDEADSFTPRNGKTIILNASDLPISPCRFSVTWRDEEEQEVSLSIVFELTWATIKEYAWSNALTVEDLQGMMPSEWYEMAPLQPEDKDYLWRRESTDNGKTWQYFRENGENGGAPQYFYKYTKTNAPNAYKGGGVLFAYRNRLFAVGKTLLGAGMAGWVDHVPEGEQYQDDYLWTKIVHADGTYDIIPPAQKGENAKDIRIVSSVDSYQLSTRGMVTVEQEFTFALQRWYVNGTATWKVDPDPQSVPNDLEIIPQDNPDILKLKIKVGSYLSSFLVSVSCEGFEATRDLRIIGINGGEESAWYFKVYPLDPNGELPVYNRETGVVDFGNSIWPTESPEGNLITGDYILYKTKVIQNSSDTEGHVEPVPYYFIAGEGTGDKGHWEMLDESSPYYSEAMGTMLADVVRMDDMPVTVGAMYGFFENLAAYNAFITNLRARNVAIGKGTVSKGFRTDIYDCQDGADTDPVFRVIYDGKSVFQINPEIGDVFFGEVDDIDNPIKIKKGFMYDASAGEIQGPVRSRFYIDQEGNLHATNASISGSITATSGTFTGVINATSGNMKNITITGDSEFSGKVTTATLESYARDTLILSFSGPGSWEQIRTIRNNAIGSGFSENSVYSCTFDEIPDTEFWCYFVSDHLGGLGTMDWVGLVVLKKDLSAVVTAQDMVDDYGLDIEGIGTSGGSDTGQYYTNRLHSWWYGGINVGEGGIYVVGGLHINLTQSGNVLKFPNLPTSPAGLEAYMVYSDGGTLKIVLPETGK